MHLLITIYNWRVQQNHNQHGRNSQVKAILVNIFGGIVDCALVARGIIGAAQKQNISIPITVRLKGIRNSISMLVDSVSLL